MGSVLFALQEHEQMCYVYRVEMANTVIKSSLTILQYIKDHATSIYKLKVPK